MWKLEKRMILGKPFCRTATKMNSGLPLVEGFIFYILEEKMKRRDAREQAFVLLFEQSLNHDSIEQIIETAELCGEGTYMVDDFAERMALCAEKNQEQLDTIVEENIRGWKMNRLSKVSLAILRLALSEMLYEEEIPVSVSINEAVELAKKYGGKEDAPFVNGVLGAVSKKMQKESYAAPETQALAEESQPEKETQEEKNDAGK